jgi:plastocyanin
MSGARAVFAVAAFVLLIAGCGGGGEEPSSVPVSVSAVDNVFRPEEVSVRAGVEVTWTNDGRNDHNIVPVDDGWGVATQDFRPGDSYGYVFAAPGTYRYYCSLHGTADAGMIGSVEVVE